MDYLRQDVRQAVRSLGRQKGVTAAALVSLALGIGANTALFSVAYGVLLRPLPYADADRLVRLSEVHPGANSAIRALLSNLTFHAWSDGTPRTLDGLAAYAGGSYLDTSGSEATRLAGAAVTPSLFSLLGARPVLGRLLLPDDAIEGAPAVVVLGYGLWQQRFGGEAAALGRTLTLDGRPHTVVGVTSGEFYFPDRNTRLWTAFSVPRGSADPARQSISIFSAVGRLRPGASAAQAAAEGTAAARSVARPALAETIFGRGGLVEVRAEILLDGITAGVRPALLVLIGGVGLVLLACCANVANLWLARGASRRRELAVRAAIGASRGRLVRQLLTESLLTSALGGALGLGLSSALLHALPSLVPASFPRLPDVQTDVRVLAFAALVSFAAGLVSGVLPALRASRCGLRPALREGAGASTGAGSARLRAGLLVAEAAFAVVLLVGASLLVRSFARLLAVDPGYDARNVLAARVFLPGSDRPPEKTRAFVDALLARLRATPGVAAAGAGNMAPFVGTTALTQFSLPDGALARAVTYNVTPGYAEALSLRLRQGRLLEAADLGSGILAMLVNEEFARSYLNDGRPIVGRRFHDPFGDPNLTMEIVGVVGNVLKSGLDARAQSEIYLVPRPGYHLPSELNVLVRSDGPPARLAPALRALGSELEPMAALEIATLESKLSASVAQPRFAAATLGAFALVALALAATGLYGVLSYNVAERRRELGVRAALGARRGDLLSLVLRQGLTLAAVGLLLGSVAAAVLARLLERLLFGITPLDGVAFALGPAVLGPVAIVACLLPAWRAASVEPTEALRCE